MGLAMEHAEVNRKQKEDEIQAMAIRDSLTGLYNRRGFISLAEQQLKAWLDNERAQRRATETLRVLEACRARLTAAMMRC